MVDLSGSRTLADVEAELSLTFFALCYVIGGYLVTEVTIEGAVDAEAT